MKTGENFALLTDLYQLTMAQSYFQSRQMELATFSLFIRNYPPNRSYFVAAGLAERCTIQISYAIGISSPTSFYVDLHGSDRIDPAKLEKALPEMVGGCTPRAIRTHLKLNFCLDVGHAHSGHMYLSSRTAPPRRRLRGGPMQHEQRRV